jgi:hypothetical protein
MGLQEAEDERTIFLISPTIDQFFMDEFWENT